MGHFLEDNHKEMGFPDEFGENMCQDQGEQTQGGAPVNSGPLPPFCGYVTPSWFGPFLLSPRRRGERGFC
jgi:hypothetical protein